MTNISTGTGSARLVSTGSTSMTPPIDGTGSTSITGTGSASANDKEKAQQARSTEVGATIQSAIEKKDPSICRTKFEGME